MGWGANSVPVPASRRSCSVYIHAISALAASRELLGDGPSERRWCGGVDAISGARGIRGTACNDPPAVKGGNQANISALASALKVAISAQPRP
jgi:hypothetical protein